MEEGRHERRDPARGDRHPGVHRSLRQARGERGAEEGGGGVAARKALAGTRISCHPGAMKRIGTWAIYIVGTLAIAYLALYAYAMYRGNDFTPGDPIHIFRKPDAPSYS